MSGGGFGLAVGQQQQQQQLLPVVCAIILLWQGRWGTARFSQQQHSGPSLSCQVAQISLVLGEGCLHPGSRLLVKNDLRSSHLGEGIRELATQQPLGGGYWGINTLVAPPSPCISLICRVGQRRRGVDTSLCRYVYLRRIFSKRFALRIWPGTIQVSRSR